MSRPGCVISSSWPEKVWNWNHATTWYATFLTSLNLFYRFYYIFLGRTMTWISEEKFIRYLHLCGPVISGLVITMHCVENLLFYCDHPTMFYYREGATSGLGPEMILRITHSLIH